MVCDSKVRDFRKILQESFEYKKNGYEVYKCSCGDTVTYTLYANTLVSGSYTLGGTHSGVFTGTEVINLGNITNNLLTFNGDLGLSNVMLIKGNSINSTFSFFRGLKSVLNPKLIVSGMNGELNELTIDGEVGLRACGDLVDTIDLMTCTLTRNLSELTLNGSEAWNDITTSENVDNNYCLFGLTVAGVKSSLNVNLACDRLNHYYLKHRNSSFQPLN